MKSILLSLFVLLLLAPVETEALERFDIVTTEELRRMLDSRQGGSNFLLINTVDKLIADHHTIPGSINIPWSKVEENREKLGSNKNLLIITYCLGYR